MKAAKRGVVLIWALVTMAVTTTVVGALAAYYTNAGRIANRYMQRTAERFAGQRDLDETVTAPLSKVMEDLNAGLLGTGKTVAEVKAAMRQALTDAGFVADGAGGFSRRVADAKGDGVTELRVESLDGLDAIAKAGDVAQIEVTALRSHPGGPSVSLKQTITIAANSPDLGETKMSHPIFNYAYFANNYGHLESRGLVVNGDVGANDDFTIDGAVINGYISAYSGSGKGLAAVHLNSSTGRKPRLWQYSKYLYEVINKYSADGADYFSPVRPTNPYVVAVAGKLVPWNRGYEPYDGVKASVRASYTSDTDLTTKLSATDDQGNTRKIISVTNVLVRLPNISDVATYRAYCQNARVAVTNIVDELSSVGLQIGGSISCPNKYEKTTTYGKRSWTEEANIVWKCVYKTDKKKEYSISRTLTEVSVSGGYDPGILPFNAAKSYRYGKKTEKLDVSTAERIERGSVILIGTETNPIVIRGPVYFDGDVLIRGFVSGQGAIYSGRNIHVLGDITYMNPPSWPSVSSRTRPVFSTDEVAKENAKRDLLLLAARGNIVCGDYKDDDWAKEMRKWVNESWSGESPDSNNTFDINDTDIGYSSRFSRSQYLDEQSWDKSEVKVDSNGKLYDGNGIRYYQSRLGDKVISALKQTDDESSSWTWSSYWYFWKYYWSVNKWGVRYKHRPGDFRGFTYTKGDDAGDITHIDAVLFANHGIFGKVGGSKSKELTLNGALICRDEGLLYCFNHRYTSCSAWLNWDMRIASDSAEGNSLVGATPDAETSSVYVGGDSMQGVKLEMYVSDWQQASPQ